MEPFCFGLVMSGDADNESLLCYQVGGYCGYGEPAGWKLYRASEIENLRITNEMFSTDQPGYDPDNLEMKTIYCCVPRDRQDEPEPKASEEPLVPGGVSVAEPAISTGVYIGLKDLKDTYPPGHFSAVQPGRHTDVDTEPGKPRKIFNRSYIRMIKLFRKLNQNKNISGDIYFHPTDRKVIVKSIDLSLPDILCEVNKRPKARLNERDWQYRGKRWIEAYLINQARNNNWNLNLQKNEYRFLLSQLKFRRDTSKGERKGTILSLLLFNDDKQYLVAREIRNQADIPVMNTARIELADRVSKLKAAMETGEIAEAFGLEEIKSILAYLVWPKNEIKRDLDKYGLIEFDSIEDPWDLYRESGKDLVLSFNN